MRHLALLALLLCTAREAGAWGIGSQLYLPGCHERITATALRSAREMYATAPHIAPSRDEAAMIDEVQFEPPSDFTGDLAAMTLLLGVRDNDLKGHNPLDSLQLVEVHGNPDTQQEHCIRAATDDGVEGNISALDACREFIVQRATEALDGLAADGTVDPAARMELAVYVSFAGRITPKLPLFYVKMGQAMHALEDGFTHTYRTSDGLRVTYVTNWIDNVTGSASNEERDGPPHLAAMDHCEGPDPLVARNFGLAVEGATALLETAMSPDLTRDQKIAGFEAIVAKYLTYEPGCTIDNNYCDAPEPKVSDPSGCNVGGKAGWVTACLVAFAFALALGRRRYAAGAFAALALLGMPAHADDAPTPTPIVPAPAPGPDPATAPPDTPAVPVAPTEPEDVKKAEEGKEPGRDVHTPTVEELQQIRDDKRLGTPYGFAATIGGSVDHGGIAGIIAGRYRINERWVVGLDLEWNPWITSVPWALKAGVVDVYGTLIRRYPMKFDRVNLRTSLHLGVSTLMFDVNGAPKHEIGPFGAFTPLGIDYDLGGATRLVIDPIEIAVPVPHIGLIPLYYEQFRFMIGIQIGA